MGTRARASVSSTAALAGVGDLVGTLMGLVHRRSAGSTLALMNEAGLTMAQMVSLYVLDHLGAQSVTAIASFLNLSPAATSHLVDRLVTGGFVGRSEDQKDRRQKRIAITAGGRALAARVHEERAREFASALALVSPELQRQFAGVLHRVVEELRTAPESATNPDHLTRQWTREQTLKNTIPHPPSKQASKQTSTKGPEEKRPRRSAPVAKSRP
jgi:DNA-binding MarR family transcriptional regulator